jgi:hypothetical protein
MLQMLSTENPYMAKGDINKDGLTDFYFGSSKDTLRPFMFSKKRQV